MLDIPTSISTGLNPLRPNPGGSIVSYILCAILVGDELNRLSTTELVDKYVNIES